MSVEIIEGSTKLKIAKGLKEFPKELYKLEETLEVLDLTDNDLTNLPDDFYRFTKLKRLFLSNNKFSHVPSVLAKLPNLSMIGIRNNQIKIFEENSLPLSTRWLILTDNELETLPNFIGDLKLLQKFMLAGNRVKSLPESIKNCTNIELLRISANCLENFPKVVLELPKLSWLAYSGNPFCKKHPDLKTQLRSVDYNKLEIKELLGQGASGNIYKAIENKNEVAIKVFKGEMTSDGLPQEEMEINILMGSHKNLVDVLAKVTNHPENKDVLMLELIPSNFKNLGLPPSFETCTRDTFEKDFKLSTKSVLNILKGMCDAAFHMHERGVMHGDFYAHNIMIDDKDNCILGDFGGASYYEYQYEEIRQNIEKIEVRALGCLIEDLLYLSKDEGEIEEYKSARQALFALQKSCQNEIISDRLLFDEISEELDEISIKA